MQTRMRNNMRLRRRSIRSLRVDDGVELPRNYTDNIIYDSFIQDNNVNSNYIGNISNINNINNINKNNYSYNNQQNGSDSDYEFEFDISMPSEEIEDDNLSDENTTIPELDINELIILANQLVRNSPPSLTSINSNIVGESGNSVNSDVSNVHIRFPLIRSINEARDVILQYERLNGSSSPYNSRNSGLDHRNTSNISSDNNNNNNIIINNNNIIWDSITQDYSGISMSGTRRSENRSELEENNTFNINVNLDNNMDVENLHRQPVWLELAGLFIVTMFMFAVYRLVTNLVSISAFSENVVGDVIKFVEYVNDKEYYKIPNPDIISTEGTSLVYKFALIIKKEMPYLPDTLWMTLTVFAFSFYTIFTSGVVLTSMLFATMCLTMCVVLRWRHLSDFILRVLDNGEHCL